MGNLLNYCIVSLLSKIHIEFDQYCYNYVPKLLFFMSYFSFSRDTTVKVWSLHDLKELRSLGFHKAAVTCVKILPQNDEMLTSIPEEERSE